MSTRQMKVVIFCGGIGTRLKEETTYRPKPMVYIGNRPILWHIMKIYEYYGFTDFVLPLGYKGEIIKDYFSHYELMNNDVTIELGNPKNIHIHNGNRELTWKVTLVDTGEKTLKGARLKRVRKYVTDKTFMLTYGDGIADINIDKLLDFHFSHGKVATVTGVNPTARFGELKINGIQVKSFQEKANDNNSLVSGGFFVLNQEIFDYLNEGENCDFEYGPLEKIASQGQLMVYKHERCWACLDTYRDMEYLNSLWNDNKAFWKIW